MDNRTLAYPPSFVSHGSPMIALEPREAGAFMQQFGAGLSARQGPPRAVLVASAHTLTREPVLLAAPAHSAVYDFGGFDPRLSTLRYDAPGAPAVAEEAAALIRAAGLPAHVAPDAAGLDHGIWTALRYLLPPQPDGRAPVPVLPLGWPPNWAPAHLFDLGRALAPLVATGVWVLGSGSITHNLRRVFAGGLMPATDAPVTPESKAFRDWFAARSAAADWPALFNYRREAPHAVLMHPTDEHLLPLFVAAGAAAASGAAVRGERVHSSHTHGDLGMDAYVFSPH
jgi:4,5-DOPA dioxygenase extradiol